MSGTNTNLDENYEFQYKNNASPSFCRSPLQKYGIKSTTANIKVGVRQAYGVQLVMGISKIVTKTKKMTLLHCDSDRICTL